MFFNSIADFEAKSSYLVRIKSSDSQGLFVSQNITITVVDGQDPLSLEGEENLISIYPNPTVETISVGYEGKVQSIQIFSLSGQLLLQTRETEINVSKWNPGLYHIKINTGEKTKTLQFIKK